MRLLERRAEGGFRLHDFNDNEVPAYAILSHTWHTDNSQEIKLQDVEAGMVSSKAGWTKLQFCADRCAADGLQWFWVDTCCIDKRDAVELSAAINSMFRWYQRAARCYVYLSDVPSSNASQQPQPGQPESKWEHAFRRSRWFTRGWTLQELIAPSTMDFYDCNNTKLGSKVSLRRIISEVTGICDSALLGDALSNFTIKERKSWAEHRDTTKEEDKVYSLLGIFNISMPLIYGEGEERAYKRLDNEIDKFYKGN